MVVGVQAWQLAHLLSSIMRDTTGGNELMMDFVAWHVDPALAQVTCLCHETNSCGVDVA